MKPIFVLIILPITGLFGCDVYPQIQTNKEFDTSRICVWNNNLYSVGAERKNIRGTGGTFRCVINESDISFAHWKKIQ
ncbi:MAG: hypothetical protein DRR08_07355 [Candidatus Parabeggiatoa sp. nov. 2]|nr:MAG: hypothetical protein B6247_15855 [Beggiatoa sp. 4572_84]RKZ61953.1 MAG: hypothetical protein DRR08_07355 [Gammaproteobacteria bacterium]HEC85349.1 hypothetical protein [Thioploca sp.]